MKERLAIDSSVLIAIMNEEPEANIFQSAITNVVRVVGWPTIFEVRIWTMRRGKDDMRQWLARFASFNATECVAFDDVHERHARVAFERYGKGRHPAALNFGDCMAYAVARQSGLPLLFKGRDFNLTDIDIHPASAIA